MIVFGTLRARAMAKNIFSARRKLWNNGWLPRLKRDLLSNPHAFFSVCFGSYDDRCNDVVNGFSFTGALVFLIS
jgi:hypothetical protein